MVRTKKLDNQLAKVPAEREADLAALIGRCATRDLSALHELYVTQAPRLRRVAMRITNDPELAADAVHDTFVQVWVNAARFNPDQGNAGAWLATIARYRAMDIRRVRARESLTSEFPDQEDDTPSALARIEGIANAQALHRCLEQLEPYRRRMLMSAYVEGLTHQEIARKYEVPLGTVKSLIRRALARLKGCLLLEF